MTLVIETGTGSATAEAYASAATFATWYAAFWGSATTATTAEQEAAIRRAVRYLDGLGWYGLKVHGRDQALAWPRSGVTDADGWAVAADTIPPEVIEAQHMLTVAEIATPGCLAPTVKLAGQKVLTGLDVLSWTVAVPGISLDAYRTQVAGALDRLKGFIAAGGQLVRG